MACTLEYVSFLFQLTAISSITSYKPENVTTFTKHDITTSQADDICTVTQTSKFHLGRLQRLRVKI